MAFLKSANPTLYGISALVYEPEVSLSKTDDASIYRLNVPYNKGP